MILHTTEVTPLSEYRLAACFSAGVVGACSVHRILDQIGVSTRPPRIAPACGPPLWEAAAAEQAGNDPPRDHAAQSGPKVEFDQRIAR